MPRYGQIDSDYGQRLRSVDADGPIYMLTLTSYRPAAGYVGAGDRARSDLLPGNREPDGRYVPLSVLTAIGASLCFVADVVASTGRWDQVTVVGYPSRSAFVQMADRADFRDWHLTKSAAVERTIVLGALPAAALPLQSSARTLLEIWQGPTPAPVAGGVVTEFGVEGTIVGDGRRWSGLRFTAIEPGTPLPLQPATPEYQALLLEPTIERWR